MKFRRRQSEVTMAAVRSREIWKDVPGWEGFYQVSTYGRVRSIPRKVPTWRGWRISPDKVLTPSIGDAGYKQVVLCRNGNGVNFTIHTLMVLAFIPNPESKPEVSHINDVKTDNRLENLEWATRVENSRRAIQNNKYRQGSRCSQAVLTERDISSIRRRLARGESGAAIGRSLGVTGQMISAIKNRKWWRHVK
jgi:hypothetical protein